MPTITPFLWFDGQAEEAMQFYASIFKHSRVIATNRAQGRVISVRFELENQEFIALNAGPQFKFTEAVSFEVRCKDQDEVDHYWSKLVDGGEESQCGWLKDRYGLSWQIVPERLYELLEGPDPAVVAAATTAMLGMRKIVVAELDAAVGNS